MVSTDGRGNDTHRFFDFYNRLFAIVDPNGNGSVIEYDDASNVLSQEAGEVSVVDGSAISVLNRTYHRYDERNRKFLTARDSNLVTNEGSDLDPSADDNSVFSARYDAGSRTTDSSDANGNTTTYTYDSVDRQVSSTDALGNTATQEYDENSNVVRTTQTEVAGPGSSGASENYVATHAYDELNRRTETHNLGLNGNSIDHMTRYAYDSRDNRRLIVDAEGRGTLYTYDDRDRNVRVQRFDVDPLAGGGSPVELQRSEFTYDRNSRKTADTAYSDVLNPATAQITRYAYDNADRKTRTVYPDSDDPIDGSSNGVDGIFDRQEYAYDPNSNLVQATDQRGVETANTFDPGNRLQRQDIDISGTSVAPGSTTRLQYHYDRLDRVTHAANNFALVERAYDPLSRVTTERQSIKLDSTGEIQVSDSTVTHNYEQPVEVRHRFDPQSNDTACEVVHGSDTDLSISKTFDPLNRVSGIQAAYFGQTPHDIAAYNFFGPGRIQTKTLGNGAQLQNTFDVKQRLASHVWRDTQSAVLVGFEYSDTAGNGYDRVDNGLYERFLHDNNLYDHYLYNDRYELVGVDYRSGDPDRPVITGTTFAYDDNYNRTTASFGDPFNADPNTMDSYANNAANEYTQLTRDGASFNPAYDHAGNMTAIPTRPMTGIENQPDVTAIARWDAANCLFDIDTQTVNGTQHYRYDPFRRRIAVIDSLTDIQGSRRFIYDGWSVCEERLFNPGATLGNAPSRLERIYVEGQRIDEHLLAAIDRDGDGQLGGANIKNQRDINADQEYYYLCNRLGSTMALLDGDNSAKVLEYYRNDVFGKTFFVPVMQGDDGFEITPFDLLDNLDAGASAFGEEFDNPFLFQGNRSDPSTGLQLIADAHYVPNIGRFASPSSSLIALAGATANFGLRGNNPQAGLAAGPPPLSQITVDLAAGSNGVSIEEEVVGRWFSLHAQLQRAGINSRWENFTPFIATEMVSAVYSEIQNGLHSIPSGNRTVINFLYHGSSRPYSSAILSGTLLSSFEERLLREHVANEYEGSYIVDSALALASLNASAISVEYVVLTACASERHTATIQSALNLPNLVSVFTTSDFTLLNPTGPTQANYASESWLFNVLQLHVGEAKIWEYRPSPGETANPRPTGWTYGTWTPWGGPASVQNAHRYFITELDQPGEMWHILDYLENRRLAWGY